MSQNNVIKMKCTSEDETVLGDATEFPKEKKCT